MGVKRLKQCIYLLKEQKDIYARVNVQQTIKLLEEELAKQSRGPYHQKYYKEHKETMDEANRQWYEKKRSQTKADTEKEGKSAC